MKYVITVDEKTFEIELGEEGEVWINRRPYKVDMKGVSGQPEYSLLVNNRSYEAHVEDSEGEICRMLVAGRPYSARLEQGGRRPKKGNGDSAETRSGEIRAPLPGLLVSTPVKAGERVSEGDVVAVMESMKMNLELRAPLDGVIEEINATAGNQVGQGDVLAVIGRE